MNHPAHYYIKYLISTQRYRSMEIISELNRLRFPVPKGSSRLGELVDYIREMMQGIMFPPRFDPKDKKHAASMEWLRKNKIYDIWSGDEFTLIAADILGNFPVRQMIEVMLLGPMSFGAIARKVREKYGMDLSTMNERVIKQYCHYYWNVGLLSPEQWRDLLSNSHNTTDSMVTAVSAPRTPVGAALTSWLADGGTNSRLNEVEMFTHMRDVAFQNFLCISADPYMSPDKKANSFTQSVFSVLRLQEAIDVRRGGTVEVLDELRRIDTIYDNSKLESGHTLGVEIKALTQGTVEGEVVDAEPDGSGQ